MTYGWLGCSSISYGPAPSLGDHRDRLWIVGQGRTGRSKKVSRTTIAWVPVTPWMS